MLVQHAQDAPLLFGHTEVVEDGTEVQQQRLSRLQKKLGKIAVGDPAGQGMLRNR